MGIHDLLPHLPGGDYYHHSFFGSRLKEEKAVPVDAASAIWQFAFATAPDYLRGNHLPALGLWARLLNYLRSICQWRLVVYLDGRENVHKQHENRRRQEKADAAQKNNQLSGQIRNTPEYITLAAAV